jgi:hypothetical protein
MFDVI